MSAAFEDIEESIDVALYICVGMVDGIADSGLCCEVDDKGE